MSDEILSHISPGHSDNVINVDVEAELAKLDTSDWRPAADPSHLDELI